MQIRRFFAKDMRSALAEVSRELGPDAAILSSRQIGGGVELLAAIDYDPSVLTAPVSRQAEPESEQESLPQQSPQAKRAEVSRFLAEADGLVSQPRPVTLTAAGRMPAPKRVSETEFLADKPREAKNAEARLAEPKTVEAKAAESKTNGNWLHENRHSEPRFSNSASKPIASSLAAEERPWPSAVEPASASGLGDLKEELRQLRGLMQEQLQGLAWRELKQRQPLKAVLTKRLATLELSPKLRDHYAASEGRDVEQALAKALAGIARDVVVGDDAMLDHGGIYAFVGATGVGKTTTIAKLAARFALRHGAGSVALISTDSFRIAAHDQLATYAHLIGCAIGHADSKASLQDMLDRFGDRRLILIDTAGMSQRDARLADQLAALASSRYPVKQLLVLSATSQRAILQESVKQFGQRRVHGAILTKLDETTSLGPVLSVLLESRLPLLASCDGQRVPEDLRSLRGAQLVDRALKLAEQFRDSPDEWLLAQQLTVTKPKATAHAGI